MAVSSSANSVCNLDTFRVLRQSLCGKFKIICGFLYPAYPTFRMYGSTIMTPSCRSDIWPTIFTILGNEQTQFLAAICLSGAIIGETPLLFPNQWTRNCMAVNTTSMTGFEQKTGFGCEVNRRCLVCAESQGDKCEHILICLSK